MIDKATILSRIHPGYGMSYDLSTIEERIAFVELFLKKGLMTSTGVRAKYKVLAIKGSFYLTSNKVLHVVQGDVSYITCPKHLPLKKWKQIFGEDIKIFDNSKNTSNTFLDKQLKLINN